LASGIDNKSASAGKGFLSGVSVLTLSAIAVKVIGLLYKIPLLSYLGTEGMGYFNTAYELYALFCIISTAGLPVAMAVLISGGKGNFGADRIYRASRAAFLVIGLLGSLVMYVFASRFADALDNSGAALCLKAISPTVLFICLGSAYRGYFQGKGNMLPTAVSQVIEAACKLGLGLMLGGYAVSRGQPMQVAAAYAVLGLTVGALLSAVYLSVSKAVSDRKSDTPQVGNGAKRGEILRELILLALPITLSAMVTGSAKFIDLATILSRLADSGYSEAEANSLYGCYSTLVLPIFNILPSLTSSVSLSATPAISSALARGEEGISDLKSTARTSMGLVCAVAIPAAVGLAVFSRDILSLLFSSQPSAVITATPWLSVMAAAVLPSCLITLSAGMLQAMGRARLSLYTMLCGIALKAVLAYALIGNENIGVLGAPVSSVACDTLVAAFNLFLVSRHCPQLLPRARELIGLFLRPTAATAVAVGAVCIVRKKLEIENSSASTVLSILTVMLIYGALMLIFTLKKHKGENNGIGNEKLNERGKADLPS